MEVNLNFFRRISLIALILAGFFLFFSAIHAQTGSCSDSGVCNPLRAQNFAAFIRDIANIVAAVGGVLAVIFIIYSGFLFVTARGNEKQLGEAKTTFTWTIIGTAVLLGAYTIATAIMNLVSSLGSS